VQHCTQLKILKSSYESVKVMLTSVDVAGEDELNLADPLLHGLRLRLRPLVVLDTKLRGTVAHGNPRFDSRPPSDFLK
jgi:hypothetical protein